MQEDIGEIEKNGVTPDITCDRFSDEGWVSTSVCVPEEMELTIYVNKQELVSILCTPTKLNCLVLGFLYSEGIISSMGDVASMRVCEDDALADVTLTHTNFKLPTKRTLTSGCGGGVAFKTEGHRVESSLVVTPEEILSLMKRLLEKMEIYKLCGGVHASALCDNKNILVLAEDIGRHNTIDKIQGECLLRGLSTKDKVLLGTGRISSEMLRKAAGMQIPIVVSRTSPTGRAVSLACELGITLVGYVHGNRLSVYSHPERLSRSTSKVMPNKPSPETTDISDLKRMEKNGQGTHSTTV